MYLSLDTPCDEELTTSGELPLLQVTDSAGPKGRSQELQGARGVLLPCGIFGPFPQASAGVL